MIVAVKKCTDYGAENVQKSLKEAIDLIGGLESFVMPGERVLIKPNLLMPIAPERAATTHPEVVRALIRLIKEIGATPVIGECPGGLFAPAYLKKVYAQCGIADIAREEDCFVYYDYSETALDSPCAKLEKRPRVASFFQECDKIISVAKLKSHGFMGYSGAVKNMFGAVPGSYKAQYHLRYPDTRLFAAAIIDIFQAVKPDLCIVDGIVGMEGDGPSGGTPREIGVLAAGANGHAVDFVLSGLIGMDRDALPILCEAIERELVIPSEIETAGDHVETVKDFILPKNTTGRFTVKNERARKIALRLSKTYPKFIRAKCSGCGVCAKNCPPGAIKMAGGKPSLDKKACINCLCCHELCPRQAIDIRRFLHIRV